MEEVFEKYRIDGSVDLAAVREAMYDDLAEEIAQELAENVRDAERHGDDRHDQNGVAPPAAAAHPAAPAP